MADLRRLFHRDVAQVEADAQAGSAELIRRLKQMSPAELLKQPWTVFDQLTAAQYREVVKKVAPDVKLAEPTIETPTEEKKTLLEWWRERSIGLRSSVLTTAVTTILAFAGILVPWAHKWTLNQVGLVRPVLTTTWPECRRLSSYTDGCIYTPTQDLNWDWVAWKLQMPVETLRRANGHLPPLFIVRRAPLVIWRETGRLEK